MINKHRLFFSQCPDKAAAQKYYREQAKTLHPDKGGDVKSMQSLNLAYAEFVSGKHATNKSPQTADFSDLGEEGVAVLLSLLTNPDLTIEVIGTWIWISGSTKPHKEALKQLGCRWNPKRSLWQWHDGSYIKKSAGFLSEDELRNLFGSRRPVSAANKFINN
jgi:hypothetical protein